MLKGKNAVITGARTGIGRAVLELFAQNGANIWACIRNPDSEFKKYAEFLAEKNKVWIEIIYMDLAEETTVITGAKEIMKQKKKIDILVNAAGTIGENRSFHMTSISEMRRVFEINFFSGILFIQHISRIMLKQKSGVIVNIASVAGIDGDPAQLEYSASKSAVINATKKLAIELGKYGIRANSVAPGLTNTKMLDAMLPETETRTLDRTIMKRRAEPIEIANAVLFLASDMSSYITGQTLRVDGGM
jgi:3-oxoacyl-[acyl-carrier protein] reductase